MCLWDIESAKCEQRHNISRNLVRIVLGCTHYSSVVLRIVSSTNTCLKEKNQIDKPFSHFYFLRLCCAGFKRLHFPLFSVQVTHVCWVPGSSSIVQTSEDKTIR